MSRGIWEAVEAEIREVRMAETERGRKERRSRKETRDEGIGEKRKEETNQIKKDRSKEGGGRIGNLE